MSFDSGRFDAVIAGGGIYGILLALEGASRGKRVLLAERDDFGSGASSNHLRTIHGGLRYLQSLDLRRAVISNRERLWWLRNFPDLVRPVTCLMPLHGNGMRRPEAFRAAFLLAHRLGLSRDGEGRIHPMRIVPAAEVRIRLPWCRRSGLEGGAEWHDAFMPWPHRVLAELLHWSESAGAVVRNRMELASARLSTTRNDADRWRITVTNRRTGESRDIAARWLINATGSAVDEVVQRTLDRARNRTLAPTLAWGLLLDRPPLSECSVAVSAPGRNRRTWFIHPYHGRVLAGTGHAGLPPGESPPARVPEAWLQSTLEDLNDAIPGAALAPEQVAHVFRGVLPGTRAGSERLLKHPQIVDHGRTDGAPGAWTVIGVKFTEAPSVARLLWDRILDDRSRSLPPRPRPVAVPSIEQARAMSDEALARALHRVAAAEWQPDAGDLVWRRTDLWMDERQARRAAALSTARQAG